MPQTYSNIDRALAFMFRRWRPILLLTALGGTVGYGVSYCFAPQYVAGALLTMSDEILGLNQSSMLGNLGGLASLVGAGATGNKESEAIETLKSRVLTTAYIEANGILPLLFPDKWDSEAKRWKPALSHVPTLADGYRIFDKNIRTVLENHKTGLVTLSIRWRDPRLAKKWTDGLVADANNLLRKEAIERSTQNLAYLDTASQKTSVMEVKTTIYKLMETEIKKQMLASGVGDYAFRVVDPAVVPERKDFPTRSVFLALGAILCPGVWFLLLFLEQIKADLMLESPKVAQS